MSNKEIAVMSLVIAIVVGFFAGMIALAINQQAKFQEQSKQECSKVSKLSSADDYHYDKNTCYLIKGNKFETVNL